VGRGNLAPAALDLGRSVQHQPAVHPGGGAGVDLVEQRRAEEIGAGDRLVTESGVRSCGRRNSFVTHFAMTPTYAGEGAVTISFVGMLRRLRVGPLR
jgi:hypothetical protein